MKNVIHFFFQGEFGVPSPEESGAWLSFIAFINIPKMWGWVNYSAYARKNFVWQFEYVPRFITVLPWIWQTWFLIRIITTLVNKYWIVWIIKSSSIVAKLHLRWNVTSKIITSSGNSWKDYTNWNSRPKICTVSYPKTYSIIMRLVERLKNYHSLFWY